MRSGWTTGIDLTPTEFAILHAMARHPRRGLLAAAAPRSGAGDTYEGYERAIDSHMKNLRQKLEPDPPQPRYVVTVHGVGYQLEVADATSACTRLILSFLLVVAVAIGIAEVIAERTTMSSAPT